MLHHFFYIRRVYYKTLVRWKPISYYVLNIQLNSPESGEQKTFPPTCWHVTAQFLFDSDAYVYCFVANQIVRGVWWEKMFFCSSPFTWMENDLGSLCGWCFVSQHYTFWAGYINDHKSDTYLIVLFAVSKFLGLIVFRLRDFSRPNQQNNLSFWSSQRKYFVVFHSQFSEF